MFYTRLRVNTTLFVLLSAWGTSISKKFSKTLVSLSVHWYDQFIFLQQICLTPQALWSLWGTEILFVWNIKSKDDFWDSKRLCDWTELETVVRRARAGCVTELSVYLNFHCEVCRVFLLWFMFWKVSIKWETFKRSTQPKQQGYLFSCVRCNNQSNSSREAISKPSFCCLSPCWIF